MPGSTPAPRAKAGQYQPEKTELTNLFSLGTVLNDTHEAILQGLNQWLPAPDAAIAGGKALLEVENFAGTEQAWDQAPLVFTPKSPEHPKIRAFDEDPARELSRVGGRIVGSLKDTTVHTVGTPRLAARLAWSDPEVEALHKSGNLGISTGFSTYASPSGRLIGKVDPSHVLLFDSRQGPPNDPRTMFLNTGVNEMTEDDTKGILTEIRDWIRGQKAAPVALTNARPDETAQKIEIANAAKLAAEAERDALKARLIELENLEKKRTADAAEARWIEMKNLLPKGLTHTPDAEAALRKEYETEPAKFALKIAQANLRKAPARAAEGSTSSTGTASIESRLSDLGIPSITISGGAE